MSVFQRLADLERAGQPGVLVTVVRTQGSVPRHAGSKMIVYSDGSIFGTIGGGEMEDDVIQQSLKALEDRKPRRKLYEFRDPEQGHVGVCGGEMEVFVEPIRPPARIVVVGCGHVGQAVIRLASWLGMHVTAVDDRPEFANQEVSPEADEHILTSMDKVAERVELTPSTYVLLTTRASPYDVEALPRLLDSAAAYIGVIGSRRRWATTEAELAEKGVPAEQLKRVSSPMGLELNAETPQEIALSIMAEIVMLNRGGHGARMSGAE